MRAVVATDIGVVELNWMWLPTIIGMNAVLKRDLEAEVSTQLVGMTMSEEGLDKAHDIIVAFLVKRFPDIQGLADYLDSMKYLEHRR